MGRHEIGEDGISYSVARMVEKDEADFRARILVIQHKCFRFVLRNGHHVVSMVALHVIAVTVYYQLPFVSH